MPDPTWAAPALPHTGSLLNIWRPDLQFLRVLLNLEYNIDFISTLYESGFYIDFCIIINTTSDIILPLWMYKYI